MSNTTSKSSSGPCVLVGAGGHARVVASSLAAGEVVAVLDVSPGMVGQFLAGVVVTEDDNRPASAPIHLAVGNNALRRRLATARVGQVFRTIIHPSALIAADAEVGTGAFVAMGASIQTGVRIGAHVIVNTGAVIDHDCVVGAFSHVAPGAVLTGEVQVGEGVLIGAAAVILPGLSIGDGATVGAGAVVTRPVLANTVATGNPARRP